MNPEEIRSIALEVAEEVGINPWGMTEFATRLLSAVAEKAEPVALYPCGFKNLHSMVIETGAFLARNLNEDEPVTDGIRSAAMVLVGYAKDMSALLAKQPLYTHPAIEPAPQQVNEEAVSMTQAHAPAVGAAPLPDEVREMVERLRKEQEDYRAEYGVGLETFDVAADLIERLAAERDSYKAMVKEQWAAGVPPDCVVVPREPTEAMLEAWSRCDGYVSGYRAMIAAGEVK